MSRLMEIAFFHQFERLVRDTRQPHVYGQTHRCTTDRCATRPYGLNRAPAVPHADRLRAARRQPPSRSRHRTPRGTPEPTPSTVRVSLAESGPAGPVAPEASPNPALLRTRPDPGKEGPGECAVWSVRVGETLRQVLGRRADRSDRTVFRLLRGDPGDARCVNWKSAVGGVYEGDLERVL